MIHAGINPYLTLHMAQVLLRAGDPRYLELMDTVAALATPTGQWPEAIHPRTRGGCMGDGQHVWAAAEWVLMVRNCFVREEGDRLILGAGVAPRWMAVGSPLTFGPAPTTFGPLTLTPVSEAGDAQLARVAARYAKERGAHAAGQAIVTCPEELRPLVPTVWSLFVFACVSFARRELPSRRGVVFPESFHLLNVSNHGGRVIYDTGHGLGTGESGHIPLRWPVDSPTRLMDSWWDRRIELEFFDR